MFEPASQQPASQTNASEGVAVRIQGKLSRTSAVALLALVLALPVAAQQGHSGSLEDIRIYNFGRVSETFYRGGQPVGRDFGSLATLGVKTVIDLQQYGADPEPSLVKDAGMQYYRIPMTTRIPPTDAQVAQFLQIVNDPAQQPVFVHCAGGRHRTGVMTAVYRMTEEGWTAEQAYREMKKYNFGPSFLHPEFKQYVYAYRPMPQPVAPAIAAPVASGVTVNGR